MGKESCVILDLCGGTGAWSRPYREARYTTEVVTLPDWDVTAVEFGNKNLTLKSPDRAMIKVIPCADIRGVLAAPPCTEFSIAKGARPRDLAAGMETVEACMRIIWEVQKRTALDFWALENPRGLLRRFLGVPKYAFEQWQFGGNKRKHTDIWGFFNPPTPTVKVFPAELVKNGGRKRAHAADWAKVEYPPEYADYINSLHGDARRAAARAVTPRGFAEAFYRANKLKIK